MRDGSGNYTLVLTFDRTVLADTNTTISSGVGSVSSTTFSGNTATVQLSGVADRQTVVLELDNVIGVTGTTDKVFVAMSLLIGDTNQNGAVTVEDVMGVKSHSGSAVDNTSFTYDTNHDGYINSADISAIKSAQVTEGSLFPDFAFTGHYYHARSGLYLLLCRAYTPAIGRWLSRDPVGESDSLNLYLYVSNNSPNRVDAFGLQAALPGPAPAPIPGPSGWGTGLGDWFGTRTSGGWRTISDVPDTGFGVEKIGVAESVASSHRSIAQMGVIVTTTIATAVAIRIAPRVLRFCSSV